MLAQRRKESCKAASEDQGITMPAPLNQLFRATRGLAGSTNARDTYVRRSSIMLKRRIAYAGALVESSHL